MAHTMNAIKDPSWTSEKHINFDLSHLATIAYIYSNVFLKWEAR